LVDRIFQDFPGKFEIREDAPKDEKAEEALLGVVRLVNTIVVDYQRS
jgi:hypothetical protein